MLSSFHFFGSMTAVSAAALAGHSYYTLPATVISGDANLDKVTGKRALDGVYLPQPNETSNEGWYFDAVSNHGNEAFIFVTSINYTSPMDPLTVSLQFALADGTIHSFEIPRSKLIVTTQGQGSSGLDNNNVFSWTGSEDLSNYRIDFNWPEYGILGSVQYRSVAPAHTACGTGAPGSPLVYNDPGLYWVNPIPDSVATVDLELNKTRFSFIGRGYHDKLFGTQPSLTNVDQWFWGHATLGKYSFVYYSTIRVDGTIAATAYVAENGKLIDVSCDNGVKVVVRPYGPDVRYPIPSGSMAMVQGNEVFINAGNKGIYVFYTKQTKQVLSGGYSRWIGNATGGKVGQANITGVALWEQLGPF